MENTTSTPETWLAAELTQRRSRNPRYSLRMMARTLRIPPGRLSEYLTGKRRISRAVARAIAERLAYGPEQRERFFAGLGATAADPRLPRKTGSYTELPADTFAVLADWHHFAILSLLDVKGFKEDPAWIARRLGISKTAAASAVERLFRTGLLQEKAGSGRRRTWVATHRDLTTTQDLASVALRTSHRQSLQQAIDALDEVPVEERDITSMTMAIDPTKLPEAKKMIRDFRRRLCAFLESGERTEVYNLNVQLHPLTKKTEN